MGTYKVTTTVSFVREIDAENEEQAEQLGYYYRNEDYEGVDEVRVETIWEDWMEEDDDELELA